MKELAPEDASIESYSDFESDRSAVRRLRRRASGENYTNPDKIPPTPVKFSPGGGEIFPRLGQIFPTLEGEGGEILQIFPTPWGLDWEKIFRRRRDAGGV